MSYEYVFFWNNSPFSQWYIKPFTVDGILYCCCEQYMMYKKALLFKDVNIAARILLSQDPKTIKALGRKVMNFDSGIWDKHKVAIVTQCNYAKFTQNPDLFQALMSHSGKTFAEASPYDTIWGIGLEETDPRALDSKQWRGSNLLGRILTQLRDGLILKE